MWSNYIEAIVAVVPIVIGIDSIESKKTIVSTEPTVTVASFTMIDGNPPDLFHHLKSFRTKKHQL